MELTDLFPMGQRWYAKYRDGNIIIGGPTQFPRSMSRDEVVAEIQRLTPEVKNW